MKNFLKKYSKYFIYLFISFIFISIVSKSTSIFYSRTYIIDSGIFQVIGNGITKGLIPYKDMFDHKGPILFFIEAFGMCINKNWGIYVLQILNCFVCIIFLEKLINLFKVSNKRKWIVIFGTLLVYGLLFSEGNLSEEWSLSFIIIALYLNLKSILNNSFSKTNYICTGLFFGIISLIRINNSASIVGFCVFLFFYFIFKKNFKELFKFIGFFLIGLAIIYIPIALLFLKWNAFYDMIYATFIFNFIYGGGEQRTIFNIVLKIFSLLPLIAFAIVVLNSKLQKPVKNCLYTIIIVNIFAVSVGYTYLHYYVILVPLFAIMFANLDCSNNILKKVSAICFAILYLIFVFYNMFTESLNYNNSRLCEADALELKEYIKDEDSILAINIPAKIYLYLDVVPSYKYFIFQSWHGLSNPEISKGLYEQFNNGNIKYIVTMANYDSTLTRYKRVCYNNSFILYELSDF